MSKSEKTFRLVLLGMCAWNFLALLLFKRVQAATNTFAAAMSGIVPSSLLAGFLPTHKERKGE